MGNSTSTNQASNNLFFAEGGKVPHKAREASSIKLNGNNSSNSAQTAAGAKRGVSGGSGSNFKHPTNHGVSAPQYSHIANKFNQTMVGGLSTTAANTNIYNVMFQQQQA